MYERMWEIISEGRRTSRPECEEMKAGTVDCNSWVGLWLLGCVGILRGWAISTFQLL
jgi:hypothetical protein